MQISLFKSKLDRSFIPIRTSKSLLADYGEMIKQIKGLVGVQPEIYNRLFAYSLRKLAGLVQNCPASEAHHHSYPGGLLSHILEACCSTLKLRQGQILPIGCSPEEASKLSDLYTYAVFAGALLHDIAKPLTDQNITLYGRNGKIISPWNPFSQNMGEIKGATHFKISFEKNRQYHLHQQSALLFAQTILAPEGLFWLRSYPDIFSEFLAIFGDEPTGIIHQLVSKGDQHSVASALGAQSISTFSTGRPLWMKIKTALRTLVDNGEITLNRAGASGWVNEHGLWLVSKRVVDQIREQLTKEGHDGVPGDNTRMFDIMSEHGLISLNTDSRAIWRCRISHGTWRPDTDFSVLLVPLDQVWSQGNAPLFKGTIKIVGNKPEAKLQNKKLNKANSEISKQTAEPEKSESNVFELKPSNEAIDTEVSNHKICGSSETDIEAENSPGSASNDQTLDIYNLFTVNKEPDTNNTSLNTIKDEPDQLGPRFHRWLQDGIQRKTLLINTAKSIIHIVDLGILVVSPSAFKQFGQSFSINWEEAQTDFQRMRINLKTENDENWFKVRVEGKRKASTLTGWIIPLSHFNFDSELPINTHLKVISKPAGE